MGEITIRQPQDKLVGANGFEPSTSWSRTRKSKIHKCRIWCRLRDRWPLIPAYELDGSWTEVGRKLWGEPLSWHRFLGHSFRFCKSVLASSSRRRGLGKGTASESPSPAALSKSFRRCRCSQKPRSLRLDFRPDFRSCTRILPASNRPAQNANAADCNTRR